LPRPGPRFISAACPTTLEVAVSVSVSETVGSSDAVRARPATSADIRAVSHTLAAAFFDDPVLSFCYPDVAARQEILPRWLEIVTETNLPHGEVYTTDDVVAGAVWVPPGVIDDEQMGAALGEISGKYVKTLFAIFERMEETTPTSRTTTYSCSARDPSGNPGTSARR
jgi:hypothetical protein